jgi:hypothetical protein
MSRSNALEVIVIATAGPPVAADAPDSRRWFAGWLAVLLGAASVAVCAPPAWADGAATSAGARPAKAAQPYRHTRDYAEKSVAPLPPTVAPVKPKLPVTVVKQADTKVHGIAGPGPVLLNPPPIPPGHATGLRTLPGPGSVSLNPQPIPPGQSTLVHEQSVHPQVLH